MINWIYQQKEMLNISDFPDETYGFVYRIIHLPTKKSYIGKKILQNTSKVKLGKKELKEYEGVVNINLKLNINIFCMLIAHFTISYFLIHLTVEITLLNISLSVVCL